MLWFSAQLLAILALRSVVASSESLLLTKIMENSCSCERYNNKHNLETTGKLSQDSGIQFSEYFGPMSKDRLQRNTEKKI